MMRRPPRSTRTDTHFLAATLVRSVVEASADAAVRGISDKDDRLAAARVRDAIKVADATQRADSSAIDKQHARVMQALLARTRSEERRVGQECGRTCRSRRSRYHQKKKHNIQDQTLIPILEDVDAT